MFFINFPFNSSNCNFFIYIKKGTHIHTLSVLLFIYVNYDLPKQYALQIFCLIYKILFFQSLQFLDKTHET